MVLTINGVRHEVAVDPDVELLTVLRDYIGLTGSKYGCGEGACGTLCRGRCPDSYQDLLPAIRIRDYLTNFVHAFIHYSTANTA